MCVCVCVFACVRAYVRVCVCVRALSAPLDQETLSTTVDWEFALSNSIII